MAAKIDAQNVNDPVYQPLSKDPYTNFIFQAVHALIFNALKKPNGYTEPLLSSVDCERRRAPLLCLLRTYFVSAFWMEVQFDSDSHASFIRDDLYDSWLQFIGW